MLDLIEKLINEHGSSAILKERLGLISDKYSLLEERAEHLEERNRDLESKLGRSNQKNRELEKMLSSYVEAKRGPDLNSSTQEILKLLFSADSLDPPSIARQLEMDEGTAQYHLDQLREINFAHVSSVTPDSPFSGGRGSVNWSISAEGRKYVVEVIRT